MAHPGWWKLRKISSQSWLWRDRWCSRYKGISGFASSIAFETQNEVISEPEILWNETLITGSSIVSKAMIWACAHGVCSRKEFRWVVHVIFVCFNCAAGWTCSGVASFLLVRPYEKVCSTHLLQEIVIREKFSNQLLPMVTRKYSFNEATISYDWELKWTPNLEFLDLLGVEKFK